MYGGRAMRPMTPLIDPGKGAGGVVYGKLSPVVEGNSQQHSIQQSGVEEESRRVVVTSRSISKDTPTDFRIQPIGSRHL